MLMSNRKVLLILQQLLILVVFIWPRPALAASAIELLQVKTALDGVGNINVEQHLRYISPSQLYWKIFSKVDGLTVSKDGQDYTKKVGRKKLNDALILIGKDFGSDWVISYQSPSSLIRHNDRDQLFIKLFDQPGQPIYLVDIVYSLTQATGSNPELTGNLYSLAGVLDTTTELVQPTILHAFAQYAGPDSLLTFNASWNKQAVFLDSTEQAKLAIVELDAAPWLAFGLILPIASAIALFRLLRRQKIQEKYQPKTANLPPTNLSPILVSVLIHKKVFASGIAALIIDLCQRGYLIIVKKSGRYFITKRKVLDQNIGVWEREIIEEMFASGSSVGSDDLHSLASNKLYSPKVRDAFHNIYDVVTKQSYFKENPHISRIRNKLIALAIYYASAFGMIWVAVSASSPYLILPMGGSMVVAILIIKATPQLANYSPAGVIARNQWQDFGSFLKENKPLPFEMSQNHSFEKYLAYAVAMDQNLAWARRFDLSSVTILKPDWFISYADSTTVEFAREVAGLTDEISKGITSLRGPLVN